MVFFILVVSIGHFDLNGELIIDIKESKVIQFRVNGTDKKLEPIAFRTTHARMRRSNHLSHDLIQIIITVDEIPERTMHYRNRHPSYPAVPTLLPTPLHIPRPPRPPGKSAGRRAAVSAAVYLRARPDCPH